MKNINQTVIFHTVKRTPALVKSAENLKLILVLFFITPLMMCASSSFQLPTTEELKVKAYQGKCFKGDCKNGTGIYINHNDSNGYYSGEWKDGKKHGKGIYNSFSWSSRCKDCKDREIIYEGEWINDHKTGQGKYTDIDYYKNTKLQYIGTFDDGSFSGKGTLIESGENYQIKYTGDFKYRKYNGKGELIISDLKNNYTTKYTGLFSDGKSYDKNGEWSDSAGLKYTGGFKSGLKDGKGTLIISDGTRIDSEWKNGKIVLKGNTNAWVKAKGGLKMRSKASADSDVILLIPNRGEVNIYKESEDTISISGVSGKWTMVQYENKFGWVFGGFLAGTTPDKNDLIKDLQESFGDVVFWTQLTKIDNDYYIYKSCNGRIELVILNPALMTIIRESGQSDDNFEISNFIKTDKGFIFIIKNSDNYKIEMELIKGGEEAMFKWGESGAASYYIQGNYRNSRGTKEYPYKVQDKNECR